MTSGKFTRCGTMVLYLIFFVACKHTDSSTKLPQIQVFVADSGYLPVSDNDNFILRIKEVSVAGRELVSFTKGNTYMNYVYDIEQQRMIDSVSFSGYENRYVDFCPISTDSFLVELNTNKLILISHKYRRVIDIDPIITSISKFAYVGYLSSEPLHVFNDTIMVTSTTSEDKKDKAKPNIPFLKANHDVVIKLLPDTAILLTMHNPNPAYFYEQDYYSDAERVYLNSGEIVYSYNHSDTLTAFHLFKNSGTRKKLNTGNFTPNSPFDYTRVFDFKYIDSFSMEQSRMSQLFYDKARHRIYATMKHKGKYIEASGKKNDWEDLPFSLFVLDEQLNQLKEIYIPPGNFGPVYDAFVTHKGFYIPAAKTKQKYRDKTLFYRIVIP